MDIVEIALHKCFTLQERFDTLQRRMDAHSIHVAAVQAEFEKELCSQSLEYICVELGDQVLDEVT